MRALVKASTSGGKGKADRIKNAALKYLIKAKALYAKLEKDKANLPQADIADAIIFVNLSVSWSCCTSTLICLKGA